MLAHVEAVGPHDAVFFVPSAAVAPHVVALPVHMPGVVIHDDAHAESAGRVHGHVQALVQRKLRGAQQQLHAVLGHIVTLVDPEGDPIRIVGFHSAGGGADAQLIIAGGYIGGAEFHDAILTVRPAPVMAKVSEVQPVILRARRLGEGDADPVAAGGHGGGDIGDLKGAYLAVAGQVQGQHVGIDPGARIDILAVPFAWIEGHQGVQPEGRIHMSIARGGAIDAVLADVAIVLPVIVAVEEPHGLDGGNVALPVRRSRHGEFDILIHPDAAARREGQHSLGLLGHVDHGDADVEIIHLGAPCAAVNMHDQRVAHPDADALQRLPVKVDGSGFAPVGMGGKSVVIDPLVVAIGVLVADAHVQEGEVFRRGDAEVQAFALAQGHRQGGMDGRQIDGILRRHVDGDGIGVYGAVHMVLVALIIHVHDRLAVFVIVGIPGRDHRLITTRAPIGGLIVVHGIAVPMAVPALIVIVIPVRADPICAGRQDGHVDKIAGSDGGGRNGDAQVVFLALLPVGLGDGQGLALLKVHPIALIVIGPAGRPQAVFAGLQGHGAQGAHAALAGLRFNMGHAAIEAVPLVGFRIEVTDIHPVFVGILAAAVSNGDVLAAGHGGLIQGEGGRADLTQGIHVYRQHIGGVPDARVEFQVQVVPFLVPGREGHAGKHMIGARILEADIGRVGQAVLIGFFVVLTVVEAVVDQHPLQVVAFIDGEDRAIGKLIFLMDRDTVLVHADGDADILMDHHLGGIAIHALKGDGGLLGVARGRFHDGDDRFPAVDALARRAAAGAQDHAALGQRAALAQPFSVEGHVRILMIEMPVVDIPTVPAVLDLQVQIHPLAAFGQGELHPQVLALPQGNGQIGHGQIDPATRRGHADGDGIGVHRIVVVAVFIRLIHAIPSHRLHLIDAIAPIGLPLIRKGAAAPVVAPTVVIFSIPEHVDPVRAVGIGGHGDPAAGLDDGGLGKEMHGVFVLLSLGLGDDQLFRPIAPIPLIARAASGGAHMISAGLQLGGGQEGRAALTQVNRQVGAAAVHPLPVAVIRVISFYIHPVLIHMLGGIIGNGDKFAALGLVLGQVEAEGTRLALLGGVNHHRVGVHPGAGIVVQAVPFFLPRIKGDHGKDGIIALMVKDDIAGPRAVPVHALVVPQAVAVEQADGLDLAFAGGGDPYPHVLAHRHAAVGVRARHGDLGLAVGGVHVGDHLVFEISFGVVADALHRHVHGG